MGENRTPPPTYTAYMIHDHQIIQDITEVTYLMSVKKFSYIQNISVKILSD